MVFRYGLLLNFCLAFAARAAGMRVGVGRVEITPQGPIWLSGYASRNHPSSGVRQPLWAKALAIDPPSGGRAVIVTTDLIGLPGELSEGVAERVRRQFGVERARLVLTASHTHTGPAVWPNLATMFDLPVGGDAALREYAAQLADDIVAVVGKAVADLAPSELSLGFGETGFAINRREPTARGIRLGVNPAGPVDHQVPVLVVKAGDGRVRAILFAYACHNTTLTGDFYEISGDYAGFAAAKLEEEHPGATAMFIQLCAGDQNPQPRNTLELAVQHGDTLAAEVKRVMRGPLSPVQGRVRAAYETTRLPFAPVPRSVFEAERDNPKSTVPQKQRARKVLAAMDAGHPVEETTFPVQVLRIGTSLTLVAFGGEVVVDYALRAKREFTGEPLIVAAYANDVMCYIPAERMLAEGGYEVVDNLVYYGQPGPFAPGVEERVFACLRRAMKKVGR
jgi:hypothetical protein